MPPVPLVVVITLGSTSLVVLAVMLISLLRHLGLLSTSLARFQEEVTPILQSFREDSQRAQERIDRVNRSGSRLRPGVRLPE
jgi:hypothetical protein